MALYACQTAKTFDDGLRIAVTHGGDSTGAIAGNMPGLIDPAVVMGHRRSGMIACADVINRLVKDHSQLVRETEAARFVRGQSRELIRHPAGRPSCAATHGSIGNRRIR